jgi:hypothetical protein
MAAKPGERLRETISARFDIRIGPKNIDKLLSKLLLSGVNTQQGKEGGRFLGLKPIDNSRSVYDPYSAKKLDFPNYIAACHDSLYIMSICFDQLKGSLSLSCFDGLGVGLRIKHREKSNF